MRVGQVRELPGVQVGQGRVEAGQQVASGVGEAGGDDAAVGAVAVTGDESGLLEAVEEAGDVGVVVEEAVADLAAGQAAVCGAAQDAQDVELRGAEAVVAEQVGALALLVQREALQGEIGAVLQAAGRAGVGCRAWVQGSGPVVSGQRWP